MEHTVDRLPDVGQQPKYAYRDISDESRRRIQAMEAVCAEAGVPLKAAALQFSFRDSRIASTVVGKAAPAFNSGAGASERRFVESASSRVSRVRRGCGLSCSQPPYRVRTRVPRLRQRPCP